jgi:hypothetical protein
MYFNFEDEMDGPCSTHERVETCIGGRNTCREKSLGRPKCRWEDNIRMVFRDVGWESVDWMHLAQDRE